VRVTDRTFDFLHHETDPPGAFQLSVAVVVLRQWVRLGVFYGSAPGSWMMGKHAVVGRTRLGGLTGWDARVGWWPRPCLTVLLHTQWEGNSLGLMDAWGHATWEDATMQEKRWLPALGPVRRVSCHGGSRKTSTCGCAGRHLGTCLAIRR
jgi:hypothetical protein